MTKVHIQPVTATGYTATDFTYTPSRNPAALGTLTIRGTDEFGFGPEPFTLTVDAIAMHNLRRYLHTRGKIDSNRSSFILFLTTDAMYTRSQKLRYIAEWMEDERTRENAALAEVAALPPGISEDDAQAAYYSQWMSRQQGVDIEMAFAHS